MADNCKDRSNAKGTPAARLRRLGTACIFVFGVLLESIAFGIAHDLVTAHVLVDYFAYYHPTIVETDSPVLLALIWGIVATWWMGVIIGSVLALCNLVGHLPSLRWITILKVAGRILAVLWLSSMVVLLISYTFLPLMIDAARESEFYRRLLAVGITHNWSYIGASIGGLYACLWVVKKRNMIGK